MRRPGIKILLWHFSIWIGFRPPSPFRRVGPEEGVGRQKLGPEEASLGAAWIKVAAERDLKGELRRTQEHQLAKNFECRGKRERGGESED